MKELSREELLKEIDEATFDGEYYGKHGLSKDASQQLKQLIESAPKEVSEAELEEFIRKKAQDLIISANILINTPETHGHQLKILRKFIRNLLPEYEALKRRDE